MPERNMKAIKLKQPKQEILNFILLFTSLQEKSLQKRLL